MLLRMPLRESWCFALSARNIVDGLRAQDDAARDAQLKAIAATHHGNAAHFANVLRTGQTAAVTQDEQVQTAARQQSAGDSQRRVFGSNQLSHGSVMKGER
jgi:hypothetical protein